MQPSLTILRGFFSIGHNYFFLYRESRKGLFILIKLSIKESKEKGTSVVTTSYYYCCCSHPPKQTLLPLLFFFFFLSSLSLWSTPPPPRELAQTNVRTIATTIKQLLPCVPSQPTLLPSATDACLPYPFPRACDRHGHITSGPFTLTRQLQLCC